MYITTPIYYVNDKPHIGHAYSTVLADVWSRYSKFIDQDVLFLTGTDEHGQKVYNAAKEKGIGPQKHCDQTVIRFEELWRNLSISNDKFIRTTDPSHIYFVEITLQHLYDSDNIYEGEYEGWYCVPCERYFTEKDLIDTNCPLCKRATSKIKEKCYYFRMARYQDWLIEYINNNPNFIKPAYRRNETLSFLKNKLSDLCISRPKERLNWGIRLPFDKDFVCYVWFDALLNYTSAVKDDLWEIWPADIHIIGKDILTPHTVYWPLMLRAMGLPQPKTILVHGWWLVDKHKMGKSSGNAVDPQYLIDKFSSDGFRYLLISQMTVGQDAEFNKDLFEDKYNKDLADVIGNMVNRLSTMVNKHFDGLLPKCGIKKDIDNILVNKSIQRRDEILEMIQKNDIDVNKIISFIMEGFRECNKFFEETKPWELAKNDKDRLATVLFSATQAVYIYSGLLHPIMPNKMSELRSVIGENDIGCVFIDEDIVCSLRNKMIPSKILFPKINKKV